MAKSRKLGEIRGTPVEVGDRVRFIEHQNEVGILLRELKRDGEDEERVEIQWADGKTTTITKVRMSKVLELANFG